MSEPAPTFTDFLRDQNRLLQDMIRRLSADNEHLRAALLKYGGHTDRCEGVRCTCGYEAALGEKKKDTWGDTLGPNDFETGAGEKG